MHHETRARKRNSVLTEKQIKYRSYHVRYNQALALLRTDFDGLEFWRSLRLHCGFDEDEADLELQERMQELVELHQLGRSDPGQLGLTR